MCQQEAAGQLSRSLLSSNKRHDRANASRDCSQGITSLDSDGALLVNHLRLYFIHIYLLCSPMPSMAEAALFISPLQFPSTVHRGHFSRLVCYSERLKTMGEREVGRGGSGAGRASRWRSVQFVCQATSGSDDLALFPRLSICFGFLVIK